MKNLTCFIALCFLNLVIAFPTMAKETDTDALLKLKQEIIITAPTNGTKVTTDHISLLGACDPQYPLYINDIEVSLTASGYFTSYVPLEVGTNTFTLRNNQVTKTLTVIREKLPAPIVEVASTTSSNATPATTPTDQAVVPSGQGTNQDSASTQNLEIVTNPHLWPSDHVPTYGIAIGNYCTHYAKPDETNRLLTPLVKGTTMQLLGETNECYLLSDYTYMDKVSLQIAEGQLETNEISDFTLLENVPSDRLELKIPMTINGLYGLSISEKEGKEEVCLTLYDATLTSDFSYQIPQELTALDIMVENSNVVCNLTFPETFNILGYYTYFQDNNLMVGFKKAPVLEEDSLKGATIVLDAGHGGSDSGAIGPLSKYGPTEKDINLQIMKQAKTYLEEKGATVIALREDDTIVALEERVKAILAAYPDLSISIHCNAMPITSDYSKVKGLLTFYTYADTYNAKDFINQSICQALALKPSEPRQSNLSLTRLTNCPALLLECGFMSNPDDYEWLTNPDNEAQLGKAIAEAISTYLHGLNTTENK